MTAASLSLLYQRLLRWLATDQQRTQDRITRSHQALVRALQRTGAISVIASGPWQGGAG